MNEAFIDLRGITKDFGGVHALRGVDMQIPEGQVTAIVGDNGAGKSTLISCLSGLFEPSSGHILIDGVEVRITSPIDSRNHGIETVYQDLAVIDTLTVAENLYLSREQTIGIRPFKLLNRRSMRAGASEMLKRVGNTTIPVSRELSAMSGGQRQAVAIVRAVGWGAKVIIFDEPTAALGVKESAEVHALIKGLRDEGITVIFISHNFEEVMGLADLVWVMRHGKAVTSRRCSETSGLELVALVTGAADGS